MPPEAGQTHRVCLACSSEAEHGMNIKIILIVNLE